MRIRASWVLVVIALSACGTSGASSTSGGNSGAGTSGAQGTGSGQSASTTAGASGPTSGATSGASSGASSGSTTGSPCGASPLTLAGLLVSPTLQLSASTVSAGQMLTGSFTLCNPTNAAITLRGVDIAARPPGGTDGNGPYGDLYDGAGITLAAGASEAISQGRLITASDPLGLWYAYVTLIDSSGAYNGSSDLPDNKVSFTVVAQGGTTGSAGSTTSSGVTSSGGAGSSSGATSSTSSSGGGVGVPGSPTGAQAFTLSPGMEAAYVVFAAPINNGGSPITAYTATSHPGGFTGRSKLSDVFNSTINGVSARIYVEGLTGGTPYTFTVTATNRNGTGTPSAPSNSVTPAPYAPYFVYDSALYSGGNGGLNPAWGQYDYSGTFDLASTAVAPPTGFGTTVFEQMGNLSGIQPYIQHVNPFHPSITGQNNGAFDLSPFTSLVSYVYLSDGDLSSYVEYQVLFCGVATASNGAAIVDAMQSWTPSAVTGGLWWNDTAGTYNGFSADNTATTVPGTGPFSAGDYYEFGPPDQSVGSSLNSVAQYVVSPTAGAFTFGQWNLVKIPLTAYDDPGTTDVSKGRILKFGLQAHNSGSPVYYAGLGFAR